MREPTEKPAELASGRPDFYETEESFAAGIQWAWDHPEDAAEWEQWKRATFPDCIREQEKKTAAARRALPAGVYRCERSFEGLVLAEGPDGSLVCEGLLLIEPGTLIRVGNCPSEDAVRRRATLDLTRQPEDAAHAPYIDHEDLDLHCEFVRAG